MKAALAVLVVAGVAGLGWWTLRGGASSASDTPADAAASAADAGAPVRVEWPATLPVAMSVYLPGPVAPDALVEGLPAAVEEAIGGPLGAALSARVARSVSVEVERIEGPALDEVGRVLSVDDASRAVAERATHAAIVTSTGASAAPVEAYYAVLAAARVIAERHAGALVDPACGCVPPEGARSEALPADGRLTVGPALLLPRSLGDHGMWFTTMGMARFGLPELEMVDLPVAGEQGVSWLLGGVAIEVVGRVLADARPGAALRLPTTLTVTRSQVARAWGAEVDGEARAASLTVGLAWGAERDDESAFVRVDAPAGVDRAAWVAEQLLPFAGVEEEVVIGVADDDAEMAAAMARAQAELAGVGARFRAGLPVDVRLLAKAPWTTRDGSAEHLWFTVTDWPEGGPLRGVMDSRPMHVDGLAAGQPVKVPEAEVEDWALFSPDGEREGAYTVDVLLKRRGE